MVVLAEAQKSETFERDETAFSRPFLYVVEPGLWEEAGQLRANAVPEKGEGPKSVIGYPHIEVSDNEDWDYFAISTGEVTVDNQPVPAWQINMRTDDTGLLLHGESSEEGDNWILVETNHQGIRTFKAEIAAGSDRISKFVRRVLTTAGIAEISEELNGLKAEAKSDYEKYVVDLQEKLDRVKRRERRLAIDPFYGRDKKTQSRFSQYHDIGFSGLGLTCLKNMVGRDKVNPKKMNFSDMPFEIQWALHSFNLSLKVPTKPNVS